MQMEGAVRCAEEYNNVLYPPKVLYCIPPYSSMLYPATVL